MKKAEEGIMFIGLMPRKGIAFDGHLYDSANIKMSNNIWTYKDIYSTVYCVFIK